jgi:class 3 adenylate cyclase
MKCAACGFDNTDGKRFCGDCGALLEIACPACGAASSAGRRFCGDCGAPLHTDRSGPARAAPLPEAERRQLTVMFCDLVGSTALSARLDPEDTREVMRAYQEAVSAVVARYDGHVAKYLGDGVLAYFGWPRAHEDNPERAVRAGLDAVKAVGGLEPRAGLRLQARIGIATGVVVAGDLRGQGVEELGAISGETANLAARLQVVAEPGEVVIGAETHRLAGALFECCDLGSRALMGFAEPVGAWSVARPLRAESRFDARRARHLTELVGRGEELEILLRRWQRIKQGEGQIVLISGEPGIGKSRLVHALQGRIADEPHTPVRLQCSPFHVNSALYPMIEHFERAAAFAPGDGATTKLDKLETLLAQSGPLADDALLFASLLSIPAHGRYPPLNMSPQRQKELTLKALAKRLESLSVRQPVIFLLEDAHWIDPTTLEFMELVVERATDAAVLVLVTHRPEFVAPWIGRPRVTPLILGRLDRRDCAALVDKIVLGRMLPDRLRDQIVAQTDGVPLFVEELTTTILESGAAIERSGVRAALAVPATLRDSLEARLDRLGAAKEVAQIGAAIGREFSHRLLAAVAPMRKGDIDSAIDRLAQAGLVFRRGTPPEATYTFKHALVQDTAYGSLLRSRRVDIHSRIANALERRREEGEAVEPEVLAHHFSEAGLLEQGGRYWIEAGQRAFDRSAIIEGIALAQRGLKVASALPVGPVRIKTMLDLHLLSASGRRRAIGPADPDVLNAYKAAFELVDQPGGDAYRFITIYGLITAGISLGEIKAALPRAFDLVAMSAGDPVLELVAHEVVGEALWCAGRNAEALHHLEVAARIYRPELRPKLQAFGREFGLFILMWQGASKFAMGYPDQAKAFAEAARRHGEELDNPIAYAFGLQLASHDMVVAGDLEGAGAMLNDIERYLQTQSFPQIDFWAETLRGLIAVARGDPDGGIARVEKSLASSRGPIFWNPLIRSYFPAALARAGQAEEPWRRPTQIWPVARRLQWISSSVCAGPQREMRTGSAGRAIRTPSAATETQSKSPGHRKRNPGSSAPRPASPCCGRARARRPRPATCLPRSTTGSARASTRPTSRRRRRCSTSCDEPASRSRGRVA